jgi:hypothetical protein
LPLQLTPSRKTQPMKRLQKAKINLKGYLSHNTTILTKNNFKKPQFVGLIHLKNIFKKGENIFIAKYM